MKGGTFDTEGVVRKEDDMNNGGRKKGGGMLSYPKTGGKIRPAVTLRTENAYAYPLEGIEIIEGGGVDCQLSMAKDRLSGK